MHIKTRLYQDLNKRLKLITFENAQVIKHFDLFNDQLNHLQEEEVFAFPACFIEFVPIKWEQLGGKRQQAVVSIRFHFCHNIKIKSSDKSGTETIALQHLETIDQAHKYLQGFSGDYFNSLVRTDSEQDHNHDHIWAHVETYKTRVTDDSGVSEVTIIDGPTFKNSLTI
jgi:hypothetical protein